MLRSRRVQRLNKSFVIRLPSQKFRKRIYRRPWFSKYFVQQEADEVVEWVCGYRRIAVLED
jgi:hypothetical protein